MVGSIAGRDLGHYTEYTRPDSALPAALLLATRAVIDVHVYASQIDWQWSTEGINDLAIACKVRSRLIDAVVPVCYTGGKSGEEQ